MKHFPILFWILLTVTALQAQQQSPALPVGPHQADPHQQIAVGAGIALTRKTTVNGIKFEPTTAGDYEVSYRYRLTRHFSAQADYDLFMNSQKYLAGGNLTRIDARVHAVTGSAVFTFGNPMSKKFESFITAGGGALIYQPRNATGLAQQTVSQFAIGGGDDYLLTPKLRIRAEVKGLTYKAPDFGFAGLRTKKYVSTVIPTLGIVYTF